MTPPSFVFFGSDELSIGVLATLNDRGFRPALVVTTPPRPTGRGLVLTPTPLHTWAVDHGCAVATPASLRDPQEREAAGLVPQRYDFGIVASYGKLIPRAVLELFPRGILNVHPSLLPQYRGATPLESTILDDCRDTGVSVMLLDEEMDHGPILARDHVSFPELPSYPELRDALATRGGTLLAEILPGWLAGTLTPEPQDHTKATYTKKIQKEDGLVDIERDDPTFILRKLKAFTPWPGVYFFIERNGAPVRVILKAAHEEHGRLVPDRVVPEGKKEMDWRDFELKRKPSAKD